MAVSAASGNAYIGFDPDYNEYGFQSNLGMILRVDGCGSTQVATQGMQFPNGMAVTTDGGALIVAEPGRPRLTRFAVDADGALRGPAVWATVEAPATAFGDVGLDGCAIDAEGCVWVANANSPSCLRVAPGGAVLDTVNIPDRYRCLACALGGEDGRTLILCGLDLGASEDLATSVSHLFLSEVSVGRA